MRKTSTTYICDGCGRTQKNSKDLRGFSLVHRGRGRASDTNINRDLCDACEARLIEIMEPLFGSEVVDLRRVDEPDQKATRGVRSRS